MKAKTETDAVASVVVKDPNLTRCAECGMPTSSVAEFHPWAFCVLFKAGISNPAAHLAYLGYVRPGSTTDDAQASSPGSSERSRAEEGQ